MAWTAAEVAENALRNIGVFSPYDLAPDPEHFSIAISRLDSLTAYIVATENLQWFEEIEQELTLTADQSSYALNALLATDLQYISAVYRTLNDTNRTQTNLLRLTGLEIAKEEYPTSVTPDYAFINRDEDSTLYPWGIPDVAGYKFHIRGRRFSGNLRLDGGNIETEMNKAWDLCLTNLLAAELGSGPIVTLPKDRRDDFRGIGEDMKRKLVTYNAKENVSAPRRTQFENL